MRGNIKIRKKCMQQTLLFELDQNFLHALTFLFSPPTGPLKNLNLLLVIDNFLPCSLQLFLQLHHLYLIIVMVVSNMLLKFCHQFWWQQGRTWICLITSWPCFLGCSRLPPFWSPSINSWFLPDPSFWACQMQTLFFQTFKFIQRFKLYKFSFFCQWLSIFWPVKI